MEFTGKFVGASKDWTTGKWNITFTCNEESELTQVQKIQDVERLDIKAVKHREKRSLDANAYLWVLLQKIAEAIKSDKWSVYLEMLKRYSRAFTHIIVKPHAVDAVKELYRTTVDLGDVNVNGQTGRQLQVYYGSSTFNTKEMAVLLDGVISECRELNIETLPPDEIERLKATWDASRCSSKI